MQDTNKSLKRILMFSILLSIFSLGFISAYLVMILDTGVETPFSLSNKESTLAPTNVIDEKDIKVFEDRVVIYVDNAKLSRYAPTGSMIPVLNQEANGIKIVPKSESEIKVGDIITFRQGSDLIVHRVVEKSVDSDGVYFVTKGDNNQLPDGKVRFNMIDSKTIAILY